jgi:hypothetical protein
MARKATVSNMAHALRCVAKLKQGKACTMAELKATAMLLESGYRTVVRNKKAVEKNMAFMERQMDLLSRFRQ